MAAVAEIDEHAANALIDAGLEGLEEHIAFYDRLSSDDSDPRTQQMAMLAFAMIPDYWEDPELSPEFRTML